ncbi:MAG: mannose-1-phosphate guanylyltransferase [Bacteroidota bacterium]|nr:mannose-1-phosphate guanylyltransferase [Bacteroidota bacterium]
MNQNNYCVIMAGGIGSRFWPLSRQSKPKQFLDILGVGRTLIQQTYDRFLTICPLENFLVVTSDDYVELVKEQLPEIPAENILGEPARRNTAPCIAYAANKIKKKNPLANMVVTPADHLVLYVEQFRSIINNAINFADNKSSLLTIGLKPTRPETGYGYIQICSECEGLPEGIEKVKTFTEKPDLDMAKVFLESGEFLWNSGIFIWSVKSLLEGFHTHLSAMNLLFDDSSKYYTEKEDEFIKDIYKKVDTISIDHGLMEKAENVYVLPADFGWSDLGTWGSLYDNLKKDENNNVIQGDNVLTYNTKNTIVNVPNSKLVVVHGLDGAIISESDGLLLISNLENEQKIRQIVNDIRVEKGDEFV